MYDEWLHKIDIPTSHYETHQRPVQIELENFLFAKQLIITFTLDPIKSLKASHYHIY